MQAMQEPQAAQYYQGAKLRVIVERENAGEG